MSLLSDYWWDCAVVVVVVVGFSSAFYVFERHENHNIAAYTAEYEAENFFLALLQFHPTTLT